MRPVEMLVRISELGLILASTYLTAVTFIKTSLYVETLKPLLFFILGSAKPILEQIRNYLPYFEMIVLILAVLTALMFWRRGDEISFGRLFSLNMIMYFPAVIDFSLFNWINLVMPYEAGQNISALWVLGVGILLQSTYIVIRYTVRFRELRQELIGRGAEISDVDDVTKNQMAYLSLITFITAVILFIIYYFTPLVKGLLRFEFAWLPYPHVVIGIACTLLISVATFIYLKGLGAKPSSNLKT